MEGAELHAREGRRSGSVPLFLRIAGGFWIVWGVWILVASWFSPAEWNFVNTWPPMICMGYGASLYNMWRSAVWLGWIVLVSLILGAFMTDLATFMPFIVLIALQAALAIYTTFCAKVFSPS